MGKLRKNNEEMCFRSVCGMPLQTAVYIIGLVELIITVIVTIANVVKYSKFVNEEDCGSKDEASLPPHLLDCHHPRLQHQVSLRRHCERLDELGGLGVHLLPRLLHRGHHGGHLLHQGVRQQRRRGGPQLWCSTSL